MTGLRIPTGRRQTSGLFTSMTEDLNSEQIQLAVWAGHELGASGLQVQRSNHSATLSPINITPGLECKLNWNKSDAIKTLQQGIYYIPANHEISVQIKLCGIEK